ncbi:TPA: RDD family protein [Klebsiella oxytoca]|uniref:RDD family protein n=1 Tax=Klebsiella oxytoca TaxID=571 RepID=A0AAN5LCY7_KLEOX|nr:RDD family protein [Klebsiella oxytoca]
MQSEHPEYEYAGFWPRTGACLLDSFIFALVSLPLLLAIYGTDYLNSEDLFAGPADVMINLVLPAILTVVLWRWLQATPGKLALRLRVLDARSGHAAGTGRYIVRWLGYVLSALPVGLGFLWIAFDRRKQGWHDKLAGTVVVRDIRKEPVRFRAGSRPGYPEGKTGKENGTE